MRASYVGWRQLGRPGRLVAPLVVLVAGALVAAGGPASAAGLTRAKVQQIAASVVDRHEPTLSVAKAARATASGDADRLGGRAPGAYLDRVAHAEGGMVPTIHRTPVAMLPAVTVTVPDGVGFVHLTGVAGFGAGMPDQVGNAMLFLAKGGTCDAAPVPSFSYGTTGKTMSSVTIDRVVPVAPGPQTFVLCGATTVVSFAMAPTLTAETVAGGAS